MSQQKITKDFRKKIEQQINAGKPQNKTNPYGNEEQEHRQAQGLAKPVPAQQDDFRFEERIGHLQREAGQERRVIVNLEDNLLSEEALENLYQYEQLLPPDTEDKQYEQEEKDLIVENLENQAEQYEYSKQLFELDDNVYVPWHCNRLVRSSNLVETFSTLDEGSYLNEWKPANAELSFGSKTNYSQGLSVEKLSKRTGNMYNTYLLYLGIRKVRNDFPFPIGVTFGENSEESQRWIPLGNRDKIAGHGEFHAILPSNSKLEFPYKDLVCFKSGPEINHYYAQKYPSHFSSNLHEGISPTGGGMSLIPMKSPVAEYIFRSADKKGWNLPLPGSDSGSLGYFIVPRKVTAEALEDTKEIFDKYLKITNLSLLSVRFTKLNTSKLAKKDKDACLNSQDFNYEKHFGVSFELNSCHVFKDKYEDYMAEKDMVVRTHEAPGGGGIGDLGSVSYMGYHED